MAEIIELEDQIEKVILVGVSEQDGDDAEDSVAELAELVRTAGAVVVGTLIQKRELMHPGTYVGTGKVQPACWQDAVPATEREARATAKAAPQLPAHRETT